VTVSWRPRGLTLVGSVLVDVMLAVPRWPERGGDVLADRAGVTPGGGFVVLSAARRLGLPARLAGRVGSGAFGERVMAALADLDVEVLLPRPASDTGFCVGLVEPDGERTFVTSPGAESTLDAGDLDRVDVGPDDAVYLSGYDLCYPETGPVAAAWLAGLRNGLVVLDPGPLAGQIPAAVLATVLTRTNLLTLNAREADLLGGDLLDRLAPDAVLVVRDGARGCTVHRRGRPPEQLPAPAVRAVDTTGAGDTHTGALLAELASTGDPVAAARTANVAAALSVTVWGSATGPDRETLERAQGTYS
jgi:sugar/nucleoside kinase (ribokinase family)